MSEWLRKCNGCGLEAYTEEDLVDFKLKRDAKFGRSNKCKACHNLEYRTYCKDNPEKKKATSRKSVLQVKRKGGAYNRDRHLQRTYGVDLSWYVDTLEKQGGGCWICKKTPEEEGKSLSIDHNHDTGEVRGILCISCNLLIAHANEEIRIMNKAIEYIKEYN